MQSDVGLGWESVLYSVRCSRFYMSFYPSLRLASLGWLVLFAAMSHSLLVGGLVWSGHQVQNGDLEGVLGKGLNSGVV